MKNVSFLHKPIFCDILIDIHAFDVALVLIQSISREVLDGLCKMLSKSGEESRKGDWTQAYSMSQMYKLQSLLLSEFPKLAKNLQFTHKHVHMIVEAVTPYLSTRQPPKLQVSY